MAESVAAVAAVWPLLARRGLTPTSANATSSGSDSKSDDADDINVASIMRVMAVVLPLLMIALDCLRKKLWYVYEPKCWHSHWKHRAPPPPPEYWGGWLVGIWRLFREENNLPQMLKYVGFDGLVMLLFLKLCMHICMFASFLGLAVLVPTYIGCNSFLAEDKRLVGFQRTTMAVFNAEKTRALEHSTTRTGLWVSVAGAYAFTLHTLYLIHAFYKQFSRLRHVFLATRLHDPVVGLQAGLSIMIEHVPSHMRCVAALEEYFEKIFPGCVHSVVLMVDQIERANALVARREAVRRQLSEAHRRYAQAAERAEAARPDVDAAGASGRAVFGAEPVHLKGCGGQPCLWLRPLCPERFVPSIADFEQQLDELNAAIDDERVVLGERARKDMGEFDTGRAASSAGGARGNSPRRTTQRLLESSAHLRNVILPTHTARFRTYHRREQRHRRKLQGLLERGFEALLTPTTKPEDDSGGGGDGELGPAVGAARHKMLRRTSTPTLGASGAGAEAYDDDADVAGAPPPPLASGLPARANSYDTDTTADTSAGEPHAAARWACVREVIDLAASAVCGWWYSMYTSLRRLIRFVNDLAFGLHSIELVYSSTAFVTFTRAVPVLACCNLLIDRDVPFVACDAPDPVDIKWRNVHVPYRRILARQMVTNGIIGFAAVCWYSTVVFCVAFPERLNAFPFISRIKRDALRQQIQSLTRAYVPILLIVSILNLLPLLFQALATFYEQRKSTSDVDRSVIERYFNFQLANVYVSATTFAISTSLRQIVTAPRKVLGVVGRDFPLAAMYFMRFVIFLLGTTPLWLLRLWPLLSRGWRTWTVEPPALPGVLYGWAFPKLMMVLIVCLTYVVIAPLIAPVAFVYFFIISIEFRYLLYYVHIPQYESGGVFWYSCVPRLLFGLTASNAILVAYFVTQNAVQTPFLLPLLLIVPAFGVYFRESYDRRTRRLSLRDAMDKDRALERFLNAHDIDISAEFDRTMYLQPSFKELLGGAAARAQRDADAADDLAHGNGGEAAARADPLDDGMRPPDRKNSITKQGGVYNPVTGPDDEVDDGARVATARIDTVAQFGMRLRATARRFSLTRTNLERQLDDAAGDSDLDDIDARGRRGRGSADENFFEYFGLQDQGWETREHRATAALDRPAFLDIPLGDVEQAGSTARARRSPHDATESEGSLASESAGEDEEKASPASSAGTAAPVFANHSPPVTPFDVEL